MKKIKLLLLFILFSVVVHGQADEPIPYATFSEIIINLNLPQYRALRQEGGFVEIEGGVKGIIVYREGTEKFMAFERNCPYKASESCARVDPDISRLFLIDRCCGSNFSISDGYPTKGPASRQLRKYHTSFSGTTLTITDEVIF